MTNVNESNSYPANIQYYDTNDPVLGGVTGQSSLPIIALANRSRYLYNYLNGRDGVTTVNATGNITTAHLRKTIFVNIAGNITLTVAALSNFLPGQRLSFIVKTTGVKCAKIQTTDGTIINLPPQYTGLWLHDGEQIELECISSTQWWLHDIATNLQMVGTDGLVRHDSNKLPRNSKLADGTTGLNRLDYARLWDVIGANAVNDSVWTNNPLIYRGRYSVGNGTSTFRLPDTRSMSWRGLDISRGVSLSRNGFTPGDYEADRVGPHVHPGVPKLQTDVDRGAFASAFSIDDVSNTGENTGNTETTVKNIGLNPIIYY